MKGPSDEDSRSPREQQSLPMSIAPQPYFYPVTPMYNYGLYVGNQNPPPVNSLNSEFEKLVQEINSKYSAQGLSDSFGMLLADPQPSQVSVRNLEMSPPATPGMSPDRTFACMMMNCGKKFTSKQSLKSHMAIHADDKSKPFECSICGCSFRRKHDLTRHHRSLHAPVKPFKCKFCNREYARSDALKRHLQSKAHSLPPELTNLVAAASRQAGFSDLV